jgi:hypothetical protein
MGDVTIAGSGMGLPNPNGDNALANTPETLHEYRSRWVVQRQYETGSTVPTISIGAGPEGQDIAGPSIDTLGMIQTLPGQQDAMLAPDAVRGRRFIHIDEWGPYDFRRPLLKPVPDPKKTSNLFDVWGPKGTWRVVSAEGFTVPTKRGTVPGFITAIPVPNHVGRAQITLEYVGGATTDVRGIVTPAGKPVRFGWSQFRIPMEWDVAFYPWDEKTDPRVKPYAYKQNPIVAGTTVASLDFAGYGAFIPGVPKTYFASVANTDVTVPAGKFRLEATTDDGIRVWIDDVLVIDSWKYQGPTAYSAPISPGPHRLHVEHFQIDGYASLRVGVRPVP